MSVTLGRPRPPVRDTSLRPARIRAPKAITVRHMPARTTSTRRPASSRGRSGSTAASKKRPPAKRSTANRRPAAQEEESSGLRSRRSSPAAGTCSPAAPAAWPARSPARRRPNRWPPSTAGTASAWPCWAWRSCWARPPGATASARSARAWPRASAGSSARWSWCCRSCCSSPRCGCCAGRRAPRRAAGWSSAGCAMIASVLGIAQVVGDGADPEGGVPGSGGLLGWAVGTPISAGVGAIVTVVLLALLGVLRPAGHHRHAGPPDPRAAAGAHRPPARPRRRLRRGLRRRGGRRGRGGRPKGAPLRPEVALGGPAHDRPDRPRRAGRRRRRDDHHRAGAHDARCARRSSTAPRRRRTCRRSTSRSS